MAFGLAESVRFELTVGCPITSFQDWLLKPLGQLSICSKLYHFASGMSRLSKNGQFFPWHSQSTVLEYIGNQVNIFDSEWYPRGRRGSPAKGVGRQKRREGSNPSHSAKSTHTQTGCGYFYWNFVMGFEPIKCDCPVDSHLIPAWRNRHSDSVKSLSLRQKTGNPIGFPVVYVLVLFLSPK